MNTAIKSRGRKIVRTSANSLLLGKLPQGCKLCQKGAKVVLFVTGICQRDCFYCPLSEKRRGKDTPYANERPIKSDRDILDEALSIDARGSGITGGDPALRFNRVLRYIRLLKRKFGARHHVHMYSCGELSLEQLHALKRAGLDEIRFHTWSIKPVERALATGLVTGVEIPVIPGTYKKLVSFLAQLNKISCNFVNLNELEFSDTNLEGLKFRGFRVKSDSSMAAKGSEEEAFKILEWAAKNTRLNVHYCPSSLKDAVQLRNRLKRKAMNVAKPHEAITADGLLVKGIIQGLSSRKISSVRSRLMRFHKIPAELIVLDSQKRRIEMHWRLAEKLAKVEPGLKFALIEEYPTYDRLETTLVPL